MIQCGIQAIGLEQTTIGTPRNLALRNVGSDCFYDFLSDAIAPNIRHAVYANGVLVDVLAPGEDHGAVYLKYQDYNTLGIFPLTPADSPQTAQFPILYGRRASLAWDASADAVGYNIYWNEGLGGKPDYDEIYDTTTEARWVSPVLSQGEYTFGVKAIDSSGNLSTEAEVDISIVELPLFLENIQLIRQGSKLVLSWEVPEDPLRRAIWIYDNICKATGRINEYIDESRYAAALDADVTSYELDLAQLGPYDGYQYGYGYGYGQSQSLDYFSLIMDSPGTYRGYALDPVIYGYGYGYEQLGGEVMFRALGVDVDLTTSKDGTVVRWNTESDYTSNINEPESVSAIPVENGLVLLEWGYPLLDGQDLQGFTISYNGLFGVVEHDIPATSSQGIGVQSYSIEIGPFAQTTGFTIRAYSSTETTLNKDVTYATPVLTTPTILSLKGGAK